MLKKNLFGLWTILFISCSVYATYAQKREAQPSPDDLFWANRGKKSAMTFAKRPSYQVPNQLFGLYLPKRSPGNKLRLQLRPNGNLLPMVKFAAGKRNPSNFNVRPNSHLFGPMFNKGKRLESPFKLEDEETFFAGRGRRSDNSLSEEEELERALEAFYAGRGKKNEQQDHEMAFYAGRGKREAKLHDPNRNSDENSVFFALRG